MVTKLLTELQKSPRVHNKIIHRHLKMSMIKKHIKKDVYLQKKDRKLLMISDQYNTIIMEYQKIIDLLDNTLVQRPKFKTKNWVETINNSRGEYNTNSQTKFKQSMLRSIICDYNDWYVLSKGTVTVSHAAQIIGTKK